MSHTWIIKDSKGNEIERVYADASFMIAYIRSFPPDYSYEMIPDPEEPEYEPSPLEQLRADVDYIAVMTGIDL